MRNRLFRRTPPIKILCVSGILIASCFFRFWQLHDIPVGITNDEAGGLYTAASIAYTGRSLDGNFLPVSFNLDNSFAPVFVYILAPFIRIFGVSLLAMRLPFALMGLAGVALIYAIVKRLFRNDWIALAAAFSLAVSPWHIHMNRGIYDGPISLFFLISLYVFLKQKDKGSIVWSLPFFAVSFYAYHATKIFLLAFVPLLLGIYWNEFRRRKKELGVFFMGCILIFLSFLYVVKTMGVTRQMVLMPDRAKAAEEINWERAVNSAPGMMRTVFSNKLTYYGTAAVTHYLQAFSTQFLFLHGEGGIYGSYRHGVLYLVDIIFLVFGVLYLVRTPHKTSRNVVFGGLLLAPLPSTFTVDSSYGLRSILMLPFFTIIIGCGMYQFVLWVRQKSAVVKTVLVAVMVAWYVFSISNYAYLYFFRYSIFGAEWWFGSSRDVSELMSSLSPRYSEIWIAKAGPMFVFQYGLFGKRDLAEVQQAWNSPWPKRMGRVSLLSDCLKTETTPIAEQLPPNAVYIAREDCHGNATPAATIRDRGEVLRTIWKIYTNADTIEKKSIP